MKNIVHLLSIVAVMLTVSCGTNDITNPPTQNPVDVYVAGAKDNHACYWKNNQLVVLDNTTLSRSNATKIIVSNNDVYVLGTFQMGVAPITQYVYWKNGVMTNLSQTLSDSSQVVSIISDMDVSGNDVYFVGSTKPAILAVVIYDFAYWKNGVKTIFSSNNNNPSNTFIKFHNNNIYLIGSKDISGTVTKGYFINNIFTPTLQQLNGIALKSNDLYVYGGLNADYYFKNITTGQETSLSSVYPIQKMVFDGGNRYTQSGYKFFKNDLLFYEIQNQNPNSMSDFEVKNGNTYILTAEFLLQTITHHLYINNVDVFNIQSNIGQMNDIAIVQK